MSYLDHPPLVAWSIRLGTLLFGDTNFGVRFAGLVSMLAMQLLLADIVWRVVRDVRYVLVVALLPEACLTFGLGMAKITPDVALIPFELAMMWSLVRLWQSDDQRWWLAAGLFGGLALALEIHRAAAVAGDRAVRARSGLARAAAAQSLALARSGPRPAGVFAGALLERHP